MREITKGILFWLIISCGFGLFLSITLFILHEVYVGSFFQLDPAWKDVALAVISGLISGLCVYFYTESTRKSLKFDQNLNRPIDKPSSEEQIKSQSPKSPIDDEIKSFCESVIAWKVSASKKAEMFTLFKDNPYYLMGYLTYITQKNIEETKILQKQTLVLTGVMAVLATGSVGMALYAVGSQYYPSAVVILVIVAISIWFIPKKAG